MDSGGITYQLRVLQHCLMRHLGCCGRSDGAQAQALQAVLWPALLSLLGHSCPISRIVQAYCMVIGGLL
jgi:hypothetical protein